MKFDNTKPYEDWFWKKNRIHLINRWVKTIDFEAKKVLFENDELEVYDHLILATGSVPRRLNGYKSNIIGVQSFYGLPDLELMEKTTKGIERAVVIGGGLVGIELVEMLLTRKIAVTFIVRENNYFGNVLPEKEAELLTRLIIAHGVDLKLETEVDEIVADENGVVSKVITSKGEVVPCQWVGIAIGVQPNISWIKDTDLETKQGVLVNECFETNQPSVYAIGDCAEFKTPFAKPRGSIEQTWYTGRMHGETLAHHLACKSTVYLPGVWFNSAKFFETEYQTYGYVPVAFDDELLSTYYWESKDSWKAFRIIFEKENQVIVGVHALGWRLKHAYFDVAISENWTLEKVFNTLQKADFDPEFFESISRLIQKDYFKNENSVKNQKSNGIWGKFKFWQS
jgi:NADPH-dependent 2,4-dienoyl-CoA reductase/sulfur reductase-like enzyme